MSTLGSDPFDAETTPDPYEVVERFWPYDGPYSDERTTAAVVMIGRLAWHLGSE